MAFLDDLSKTLSSAGQDVAQKTKEITEAAKLNAQIVGLKSDLDKLYLALGKAFYQSQREGQPFADTELIEQIAQLQSQIEQCHAQLEGQKKCKKCRVCGAQLSDDALFCDVCGAKQEEKKICSNCGSVIAEEDVLFCPNCGNKL